MARGLNLKHLRYFAETARRGSITAAAKALHMTPQTLSSQIRELEAVVGQPLFERVGRRLVLAPAGTTALEYANGIFALSDELAAVLRHGAAARNLVLRIGITDSVPKLLSVAILQPVIDEHGQRLELSCREGALPELLGQVIGGQLDAVLTDSALPPALSRPLHASLISESGISFVGSAALAGRLTGRFPACLHDAPFLTSSSSGSLVTEALELWFTQHDLRPRIVGRIDDSALLKGFARKGLGLAAIPTIIEKEVLRQYQLVTIGRTNQVRQPLYLVGGRDRRPHPLLASIRGIRQERRTSRRSGMTPVRPLV